MEGGGPERPHALERLIVVALIRSWLQPIEITPTEQTLMALCKPRAGLACFDYWRVDCVVIMLSSCHGEKACPLLVVCE